MIQSLFVIGHSHGSDEREHVPGKTEGDREHEGGPWQREVKDGGEATAGGHWAPEDPKGTVDSLIYTSTYLVLNLKLQTFMYFPIFYNCQKKKEPDFKIWNGCFSQFYGIYGNINSSSLI